MGELGSGARTGHGCLSSVLGVLVLAAVVALVVLVGFVVLAVVAGLVVVGLVVYAADRLFLAVSPKHRERRAHTGVFFFRQSPPFGGGEIIDASATESPPEPRAPLNRPEGESEPPG